MRTHLALCLLLIGSVTLPARAADGDFGHAVRLTRSGQVDATFGSSGETEIDWNELPGGKDNVSRVRLAPDGGIWVSGTAETPTAGSPEDRAWIARLRNSYLFADGFERGSIGSW